MTVEKIDIINLAEISFNIVKEFRAKNKYKYKTHLIMVKRLYKSRDCETGKYYCNFYDNTEAGITFRILWSVAEK
jgi:hypothetical protein